jgi:methionyl-tRNA formyltransferase
MRILFAGSPAIAIPALKVLAREGKPDSSGAGWELAGILTNPDSPRLRSGQPRPTDLSEAALVLQTPDGRSLPQLKPEKLDAAARKAVAALDPELLVSFAYGKIFGPRFLALFPRGGINIHPSLLPKYRGAAPIPAAILHRERETGITVQRLALKMDSGDILVQERFPLTGRETAESLSLLAAQKSAALIGPALRALARGELPGRPQNHGEASYTELLSKEGGRVDWTAPAQDIDARIRAFTPWPLAWTTHGKELLYLLEARPRGDDAPAAGALPGTVLGIDKGEGILVQTGKGILALTRLQYRARKALEWRAFLNGARNFTGSRLGGEDEGGFTPE